MIIPKEEQIRKNTQYALAVIKENVDNNSRLTPGVPLSKEDLMTLAVGMLQSPNPSFNDLAKSPKMGNLLNTLIIQGTLWFEQLQGELTANPPKPEIQEELMKLIDDFEKELCLKRAPTRKKDTQKFVDFIACKEYTDAILSSIQVQMSGKTGKAAALVMQCAMKARLITKPTFTAIQEQFGNVGSKSNFNKYMNYQFNEEEEGPIMMALKRQLPELFC